MTEGNENFEDLSIAFSMDALDDQDRELFKQMLDGATPIQKKVHRQNMAVTQTLARSIPERSPHPRVRTQLMQHIHNETVEKVTTAPKVRANLFDRILGSLGFDVPTVGFIWTFGAVAAAILVVYMGLERKEDMTQVQKELASLQARYEKDRRALELLNNADVQVAGLGGEKVNPGGSAQLVWNPVTNKGFLRFDKLPPAASNKDYQLWFIGADGPVSAGVFSAKEGTGLVWLNRLPTFDPTAIKAFGVTLEPKGGVTSPTGAMYLLGTPG